MMFDPNEISPIGKLFQLLIQAMIAKLPTELPIQLITRYGDADTFTPDYITRFALAVYLTTITFPYSLLQAVGLFNIIKALVDDPNGAETFNVEMVTRKIQSGFTELSPTFAAAVTSDVIILTAKLVTLNWLLEGDMPDTMEAMHADLHIYFHAAMEQVGTLPDGETVFRETAHALTEDDDQEILNLLPPHLLAILEQERAKKRGAND